jgi:RimJ/RimL family protein N-acetyltransferase
MTLKVRRVSLADAVLLWEWRNDGLVRRNSFSTELIPWEDHQRWLAAQLASPTVAIYIVEDGHEPVAQVRYERRGPDEAEVHISVAAAARGRGFGKAALTDTVTDACAVLGVTLVFGLIKEDNAPSLRAFKAAGYEPAGPVIEHGARCYKYVYRAAASRP